MTPIKRYTTSPSGEPKLSLTLDSFAFIINSIAMGDVLATAPVIKYLVENYYTTPESYLVVVKKQFREFFPFIPDSNIKDFDSTAEPFWGIPQGMAAGLLNKKSDKHFTRNTPKAMHLSHYASIGLADRIIPLSELNYVPLEPVDISHFGIDFTKSVILITSYRDTTRMWYEKDIIDLAKWISSKGLTPIFIGKTDMDLDLEKKHLIPKSHLGADASQYGIDLRNKTTIPELAAIFDQAIAVCGVDSGPIHLAGTTEIPIICAYPTVLPEYRIPTRKYGVTFAITPKIECGNCESRWKTSYHPFENCYYGHADCCKEFTADKYIEYLEKIIKNHLTRE